MISIHTKTIDDTVMIPLTDWELIKDKLINIKDVEIIDQDRLDALESLIGLGKDIWGDTDPVEYQKQERSSW